MNKSRGRPRGHPHTRERIVEIAHELFLARGYRGTTVRAIAAGAGVDSALISYHFGSKQGLFSEVIRLHCSSPTLTEALQGDREGLPERLLRAVTDLWDGPAAQQLTNRAALHDEDVMRLFRAFLKREILDLLAEYLGGPDATQRAAGAVAVIGGLIFTRYLNPLDPLASMTATDVQRILAPSLRAALRSHPTRSATPPRR
jgi:AcrR family transcriptional regulator